MRTTQKVCLYFLLFMLLPGLSNHVGAQNTMSFQYGENDEFEGSLTAYLVMIGVERTTGKQVSQILRPSNFTIDYARYEDIKLILRLSSFVFAREEHYANCWLELPLNEYINKDLPGLILESKTKVLMLGDKDILRARKAGDIRYRIDPSLDREVQGAFRFSFDFISSNFPWKKITFQPALEYAIHSALPIDKMESGPSSVIIEEAVTEAPEVREEKMKEELPTDEVRKMDKEEADILQNIEQSTDNNQILSLCEEYQKKYPDGRYLDDVLYQQILATVDPASRALLLEEYVDLFPEGDHILKINEMIFSDFSSKEIKEGAIPKERVAFPDLPLSAVIKMKDGILSVNDIKGGQAPFRLEFFDANETNEKKYALDIGKNRAFKINLNTLPLEKNVYVIRLLDANGTAPFHSDPVTVVDSKKLFKVEMPFISMVLGISILVIAVFLLIISQFFSKKRKRKRYPYTSKSYR